MKTAAKVQYITDQKGARKSVVLPLDKYEAMLEDIQDLVVVAERKKEKTLSMQQVLDNLRSDGLI